MNDSLRSEPEVGLVGSRLGARVPRAARAGEEREREREYASWPDFESIAYAQTYKTECKLRC